MNINSGAAIDLSPINYTLFEIGRHAIHSTAENRKKKKSNERMGLIVRTCACAEINRL